MNLKEQLKKLNESSHPDYTQNIFDEYCKEIGVNPKDMYQQVYTGDDDLLIVLFEGVKQANDFLRAFGSILGLGAFITEKSFTKDRMSLEHISFHNKFFGITIHDAKDILLAVSSRLTHNTDEAE